MICPILERSPSLILGLGGGGLFLFGASGEPQRIWANLMVASYGVLGLGLGGAVWLALFNVTGARWSEVIRPVAERLSLLLPVGVVGVALVLIADPALYPWTKEAGESGSTLREYWRTRIHPRSLITVSFEEFWDQAVHDGWVRVRNQADLVVPGASTIGLLGSPLGNGPLPAAAALFPDRASSQPAQVRPYNPAAVIAPIRQARVAVPDSFTAILYAKVGMPNSSHAYNPWLQELPDPISKVTWDNYACLSPAAASRLAVRQGDVVRFEGFDGLELPVLIQAGQHDQVVAIALGYGSKLSERFANIGPPWLEARSTVGANGMVGVNAARLLCWQENLLRYQRDGIRLVKTGRQHPLACTQQEPIIRQPLPMADGSRGVMEKCTFCVQRIQEAKIEARRLGLPVADGDIQTACQQSCPTKVIAFGNLNDPQSKAAQLAKSTRAYKVLEELNVQPAVSYLAIVRNRPEGAAP